MDNNNMKTIQFLKDKRIQLNGVTFKPYCIGDLPPSFGCIAHERDAEATLLNTALASGLHSKAFATYQSNYENYNTKFRSC